MSQVNRALAIFSSGFACSQAVLAVFCERYGLDETTALRIATGFAGGMKRADVCGAVTGAIMVIGLKYGHVDAADRASRRLAGERVQDFMTRFTELHGAIACRDLLQCDITTPEGRQFAMDNKLFTTRCHDLVVTAVEILEQSGY
ncbi:putative C_GCAxxG_C_C family redox protein [uncultured delta proteobacterium]|uniref:Putative C_GCAxxG_C_C family redox protein n=1 Tax=uncultured delta proteobacterium TaxID=34034 RepID=A0A212JP68_9DELT|nr:putative C_GCAxxG_C_C family redox protein [uncultured delta proteobacterium]